MHVHTVPVEVPRRVLTETGAGFTLAIDEEPSGVYFWEVFAETGPSYGRHVATEEEADREARACLARLAAEHCEG